MTAPVIAREEHQAMEFSVSKSALLNELSTTQGVVERKTTIPILSNLLVEAKGSQLIITATDLELSIRTSCEAKVKKEGAGTIPAKKLLELVRLLPEGEIKFKLLDNHWVEIVSDRKKYKLVGMAKENFPALPAMPHVLVRIPATLLEGLIPRILTGKFSNSEGVLSRDNNKSGVLERAELSDAVRRVSQLADQRSHAVKMAVSKEGIEISASSPEYGEAKETIEKDYKGDPISIGFNSSYVLDFLAAAAEGPISIELKDEQSAGQMRPLADESYRYRYIIMRMRI